MRYRIWGRSKSGEKGGWLHGYDSNIYTVYDRETAEAELEYMENYTSAYDWVLVADGDLHDELDEIWEEWEKLSD